jgi:hypothetical protein
MPPTNAEDLNSCHDSCARIIKVEICVPSIVQLHLCLLGCICFSGVKGLLRCAPFACNLGVSTCFQN